MLKKFILAFATILVSCSIHAAFADGGSVPGICEFGAESCDGVPPFEG